MKTLQLKAALEFGGGEYWPLTAQQIGFVVGRFIVLYNYFTLEQEFVPLCEGVLEVQAQMMAPNRKYLALGEATTAGTCLSFYALTGERKSVLL
jgi:hypothetical protein